MEFNCIGGNTMDYYAIGQRIRRYRKAQGLSQEQLAEKVNISTTHMSHIENGGTKLSLQVFAELAEALHVSADCLLYDARSSSNQSVSQEITQIIDACTPMQARALKEIMKAAQEAMRRYL